MDTDLLSIAMFIIALACAAPLLFLFVLLLFFGITKSIRMVYEYVVFLFAK